MSGDEQAEPDTVRHPSAREQPVKRPQRHRQTLGLLQLKVRHVVDPVGNEREDEAGEDGRCDVPRQRPYQQRRSGTGQDETGQQHQVVDQQRRDANPLQRRRHEARQEQRFGESQRLALGIEDVGVEQPRRRPRQLVRHPRERPGIQQRIAVVVHAVAQMQHLRIGHHGGQRRERQQHRREELHDWRMSSSSVSADSSCCAA